MNSNPKLSYAIAAILSGSSVSVSYAAATAATDTADSEGIQEIVVTAQRRNESIKDVPITIQAITGEQLGQLNVTTFDDVLKYLPNVTFSSNGPGQGNIYMRGLSAGFAGNQSSAAIDPFPNVATYLDDQSMPFPARNVDVYMVDMERVEVLEGPQGTLFGGGAEAGAIRYITNKPKLNVTEGSAEAVYGITAHGDPNTAVTAVLNVPLIPDTLAVACGHLQRSSRRLHRQRAEPVHALPDGSGHDFLSHSLPGGRRHGQQLRARREGSEPGRPTKASAPRCSGRSTTTGMC